MTSWRWLALGLLCVAAAGCCRLGGGRTASAALEQENRQLEDRLYQAQYDLEKCQEQLERARSDAERDGSRARQSGGRQAEADSGPRLDAPDNLQPPTIEMPSEPAPSGSLPDRLMLPGGPATAPAEPPVPQPTSTSRRRPEAAARRVADPSASRGVARISLSPTLTGGFDADRRPGDEGIMAVIEPRDSQGRLMEVPAAVSVVIIDPALSGKEAKLARWDYTAEQVAGVLAQNSPGTGIPLEVRWPGDAPDHDKLHLYVRYTTVDGRKLETDRLLEISLPGANPPAKLAASAPATSDWRGIPLEYRRRGAAEPSTASPPVASSSDAPGAEVSARPRPIWAPTRR